MTIKSKKSVLSFYILILVGSIFSLLLTLFINFNEFASPRSSDQVRLITEIRSIADRSFQALVIEEHDRSMKQFGRKISSLSDIKAVWYLLQNVNSIPPIGGHVLPIYECSITFILKGKKSKKYLVRVFNDKPSDAYLDDNYYDPAKGNRAMKPIIIPRFGKWLLEHEPRGKVQ